MKKIKRAVVFLLTAALLLTAVYRVYVSVDRLPVSEPYSDVTLNETGSSYFCNDASRLIVARYDKFLKVIKGEVYYLHLDRYRQYNFTILIRDESPDYGSEEFFLNAIAGVKNIRAQADSSVDVLVQTRIMKRVIFALFYLALILWCACRVGVRPYDITALDTAAPVVFALSAMIHVIMSLVMGEGFWDIIPYVLLIFVPLAVVFLILRMQKKREQGWI
jgi:uncharacterized protein (DUF779 family)